MCNYWSYHYRKEQKKNVTQTHIETHRHIQTA